jgi:hypothetical protein
LWVLKVVGAKKEEVVEPAKAEILTRSSPRSSPRESMIGKRSSVDPTSGRRASIDPNTPRGTFGSFEENKEAQVIFHNIFILFSEFLTLEKF